MQFQLIINCENAVFDGEENLKIELGNCLNKVITQIYDVGDMRTPRNILDSNGNVVGFWILGV